MPAARSLRFALYALVAGQVAALGGCGAGDQGPRAADAAPTTSTGAPGRYAGSGELLARDRVRRRGPITYTPLARYTGRVAIDGVGSRIAVAVGGTEGLELRLSERGELPRPASGSRGMPSWAQIHFGTDANGQTLITYPSCESETIASCDLVAWDPKTRVERPVDGAADSARAETEGVMDRGDLLFTLDRDGSIDHESMRLDGKPATTELLLHRAGQAERTLTRRGGRRLVFAGGTIGELGGRCGDRPRLLSPAGRETFHFGSYCGFNESVDGVGSSLARGHFSFAFAKSNGNMQVIDHQIGSGARRASIASIGVAAQDWLQTGATSGIALTGFGCRGLYEDGGGSDTPRCLLVKVDGLRYRRER